ncbi:endonuclease/exonuclease/phosphatase family protein [Sphingomonas sp. 2R-10]|uniref:endonuclease/exonuclease/phosphatase family protein n=1 Tax=Sphingomonas sp. 2R-10 TaxID=3045148 RepID=UPI0019CFCCAD|nr:endonuclease/exonuclease/phosphatase family protein [Sphingomonas sp. 2R-10]MDJ0275461.1 endonuclease/exonuclease/phosphatase family protein [Sphingomonas sp. 2R-10]
MIWWLLALGALASALPAMARDLTVMTLNIRLPADGDGANRWELRRDLTAATVGRADPDVIGTQELFKRQGDDLVARLPRYRWIGVGRSGTGRADDEHMGIFYRADRLQVERWGNFWLSDTPDLPGSISWGHPYPRMVTWVIFREGDGKRFAMFNTHLPYRAEDEPAREKGAALLASRIPAIAGDLPVVVTGDFNTVPESATHRKLEQGLTDAWTATRQRSGPEATFHGFTGKPDRRIDWIFARGFTLRAVRTIDTRRGALFPSDHYPVVATLRR